MVEITYQVVLSTLQTVGILIGIIYYLFIMRNSQRTQQQTLEARRTEIFLRHYGTDTEEHIRAVMEIQGWEWTDYDDWREKYWSNPDKWSKFASNMQRYNGLGLLAMQGQVDVDLVYKYTPAPIIRLWDKFRDVIREGREDPRVTEYWEGFEYLYDEMMKRRKIE